ncbi:hypothetical protein V6Z12_A03G138900 [Gossypium hirsutum]
MEGIRSKPVLQNRKEFIHSERCVLGSKTNATHNESGLVSISPSNP